MCRTLDVSGNKLSALPPEIGKLKRLTIFKCSGNKIRYLPPEIGKCKLLEELVASENELSDVPDSFAVRIMVVWRCVCYCCYWCWW